MDKSKAEFEKWYFEDLKVVADYDLCWQAWQASRKALVVELPVTVCRTHVFEIPYTHEVGMEHDEYFEVDDIHNALDASGVNWK